MTVHVAGNACLDTTFRLARLPRPGETLNAASGTRGLGGKGANQAVAAARTGAPVALHAVIGTDAEGDAIRRGLSGEGLDLEGLLVAEGPSDGSAILVDAAGENAIVSLVDRARDFDPLSSRAFADRIAAGDLLLMQGNLPLEATHRCLDFARTRGATTILNASPIGEAGAFDLGGVDWLVVNAPEASLLSGSDDREAAVRHLLQRGVGAVLLSLGAGGAIIAGRNGGFERIPASEVKAIDTSGAGDVLCGVFAGLLALGLAPHAAIRVAVSAAGIAVTRPGTLAACPSAAEIAALLSSRKEAS